MGGGFRFGVPLFGGLVCSENERLTLQAAFTSSVCEKGETHYEYWYLQASRQQILESALQRCCASPKFCLAVKSTICTLSSTHLSAMTVAHVPLL
jgi:hypothetical protein